MKFLAVVKPLSIYHGCLAGIILNTLNSNVGGVGGHNWFGARSVVFLLIINVGSDLLGLGLGGNSLPSL